MITNIAMMIGHLANSPFCCLLSIADICAIDSPKHQSWWPDNSCGDNIATLHGKRG